MQVKQQSGLHKLTPSTRAVFPILLVNFIGTLGYSIILPFMVVIVLKLGGNEIVYGILGATYSFFQFIGAPVLGGWSDKFGRKKILLLSSIGTLIGWLVFLIALILPDKKLSVILSVNNTIVISIPLMTIFFARAIDGITGGNISVANAYLADISTRQERKRNFGKMAASANLGLIFGPVLAGVLGATFLGNILPVAAAALISLFAIVIISLKLEDVIPEPVTDDIEVDKTSKLLGQEQRNCYQLENGAGKRVSVFTLPNVRYFIVLYFLIFLAFNFFYVSFPVFAAQQLHWTVLQLGIFFSFLSGFLVLIQGPVLSWLTTKFASAYLVIAGCLLLSVSFVLFRSLQTIFLYSGALFFAVGNGIMWPSFLAILSNIVADKYQGTVQGYASSAGSLASIIGLLAGAFLYKNFGQNIFLITTFLIILIAFLSYPMVAIEKKNSDGTGL